MELSTLALFLMTSLALNLTPGQDMMFVIANGISGGQKAGIISAMGINTGALVHVFLAAAGVSALIQASEFLYELLRYGGAAYLVWLGVRALRAGQLNITGAHMALTSFQLFRNGVVTNVLNPKVALFFMALLPQFVDPANPAFPVYQQILLLGFVLLMTSTIVNVAAGIFAGRAGQFLSQNSTFSVWLNRLSAVIFFGLAVRLVTSSR
jgi:threonine/homoserine/homoserine lactone efflux protein